MRGVQVSLQMLLPDMQEDEMTSGLNPSAVPHQ
jgi:hypothetical protein